MLQIIAAALLMAAPPAAPVGDEPATPERTAAASAEADRLIAKAGVADLFDNVSTDADPWVRHRESGMECHFSLEIPGAIWLAPKWPRGEAIACEAPSEYWITILTVRRAPAAATSESELADALDELMSGSDSFERTGEPAITGKDVPQRRPTPDAEAWLRGKKDGVLTYVVVRVRDGWTYRAHTVIAPDVYAEVGDDGVLTTIDDMLLEGEPEPSP